jgi:hypothetical protein
VLRNLVYINKQRERGILLEQGPSMLLIPSELPKIIVIHQKIIFNTQSTDHWIRSSFNFADSIELEAT